MKILELTAGARVSLTVSPSEGAQWFQNFFIGATHRNENRNGN